VLQHLFCFGIAIVTVVLLSVVFICNKLNNIVTKANNTVAKIMMADGRFLEQLNRQIALNADTETLTDYIGDNISDNISSEYPMLEKYINVDQLSKRINLNKQLSGITQGVLDANTALQIVQTAISGFTDGIRSRIKSTRLKTLLLAIFFQVIAFGAIFYQAGKYRSPVASSYSYESNDYL